jgi:DnaK suppressor protein
MAHFDKDFFRGLLLEHKERLLMSSVAAFREMRNGDTKTPSDEADFAVEEVNQYMTCQIQTIDRKCLIEIERALAKVENGEYGFCEFCGEEIDIRRLKARPYSNYCVECQEDMEVEQNRMA